MGLPDCVTMFSIRTPLRDPRSKTAFFLKVQVQGAGGLGWFLLRHNIELPFRLKYKHPKPKPKPKRSPMETLETPGNLCKGSKLACSPSHALATRQLSPCGRLVLGSLILYLKGRRRMMFQLSGFYCNSRTENPDTAPATVLYNPYEPFYIKALILLIPTWRIMGLSRYGYKYFNWGYKCSCLNYNPSY